MRIYISEKAMKKKPEDCTRCPMCDAETDDCLLLPVCYQGWDEQYKNCPLQEKRQPNPFNSVMALLRDFDLEQDAEFDIAELADMICQLFKDGAYD